MRVIFYFFLFIIGISLSLIILMPSLFDVNNYKKKIESIVFAKTKNILKIKGDIKLSIFSGTKFIVKDITYKKENGIDLFSSEELIIAPQFFPLLKGQLVFNSIKLIRPIIFIQNDNGGKVNWEVAFSKKEEVNRKGHNKNIEKENNKNNFISSEKKLNPLNMNQFVNTTTPNSSVNELQSSTQFYYFR